MIEAIGWVGSVCFALCGLPQAIQTIKTKSAKDFSIWFLGLWLVGEVLMIVYTLLKLQNPQLLFNYFVNLLCLLPIIYYKIKELGKQKHTN